MVFAETGVVGLGAAAWVGGGYAGEGAAYRGKGKSKVSDVGFWLGLGKKTYWECFDDLRG